MFTFSYCMAYCKLYSWISFINCKMLVIDWGSGLSASPICCDMWYFFLVSSYFCHSTHIGDNVFDCVLYTFRVWEDRFFSKWCLCVINVCPIRNLFRIVSSFLFSPGLCHVCMLFFIWFNFVFSLVHSLRQIICMND